MAEFIIKKVAALPADASLTPSTMYLVPTATDANRFDVWLTSKTGGTITKRRLFTNADIDTLILAKLDTEIGDRETDLVSIYNTAKA